MAEVFQFPKRPNALTALLETIDDPALRECLGRKLKAMLRRHREAVLFLNAITEEQAQDPKAKMVQALLNDLGLTQLAICRCELGKPGAA